MLLSDRHFYWSNVVLVGGKLVDNCEPKKTCLTNLIKNKVHLPKYFEQFCCLELKNGRQSIKNLFLKPGLSCSGDIWSYHCSLIANQRASPQDQPLRAARVLVGLVDQIPPWLILTLERMHYYSFNQNSSPQSRIFLLVVRILKADV